MKDVLRDKPAMWPFVWFRPVSCADQVSVGVGLRPEPPVETVPDHSPGRTDAFLVRPRRHSEAGLRSEEHQLGCAASAEGCRARFAWKRLASPCDASQCVTNRGSQEEPANAVVELPSPH
jgi:hypothetical protein